MSVNTKQVRRRSGVHYESLDDLLAEAERFAAIQPKRLGNWSLGQICAHLAKTMNSSIDGFDFSMPAPVRWVVKRFMLNKMLSKGMPAGFKTSKSFDPPEISDEEGITRLREAVQRQQKESNRVVHPGFGDLSNDEWAEFHLRHAELHMSFLDDPS